MAEKVWRSMLDVTQSHEARDDRALIEQLARAVADLNLEPAFMARLGLGVGEAIRRVWQHDRDRAQQLTVAVLALRVEGKPPAQTWGFFLVEKRLERAPDWRVEVRLYPEGHR